MNSLAISNENVNPLTDDQRDTILNLAAGTYLITNNSTIKSDMLDIIMPLLSDDFTRHITPQGVVIERLRGEKLEVHPFVTLVDGRNELCCPNCAKELAREQILGQQKTGHWTKTTVQCSCGYFVTILEGGARP